MALLGIPDEPVRLPEQCTHRDNLLGGCPIFADDNFDPARLPGECDICREPLHFLLQLYCPVDQSTDDRCLYLFVCTSDKCSDLSIKLIRVVTKSATDRNNSDGGGDPLFQDDWALAQQFKDELNLEKKTEIMRPVFDSSRFRKFSPHYLAVIEEPDRLTHDPVPVPVPVEPEIDANEKYEKNYPKAFRKDRNNYKFYKTLQRCPEQVLRYQWSGTPLYPSDIWKRLEPPERCQNCGSPRIFEFQLMPALINFLGDGFGLEFETILAFTCARNCTNQPFCQEQIILFKEDFPSQPISLTGDRQK